MKAADWVKEGNAAAPVELLRAMTSSLADAKGGSTTAQLTSASRALARKIAAGGCGDRSGALDLLTLDALMTSAMESAATSEATCEAAASSLLSAISEAAAIE